jgi:hypothetical protein
MGNPPSKASEGGRFDIFMLLQDFTFGEFRFVKETVVLFLIKVRPCLRRSGYAQAGRSLSERLAHVRVIKIFAMLRSIIILS